MTNNIIFIGGIHGVGKGTICQKLSERYNFIHISASEVLKWEEISEKENKNVKNFQSTQERLIYGLNEIIKPDKKYLLDGHFCLLNSEGFPESIPEVTFSDINPSAIVIITCDLKTILNRLQNRDSRLYDITILRKMQKLELESAEKISLKLNLPFFNIESSDDESLQDFLTNYESTN
jgi:adenylate kinase